MVESETGAAQMQEEKPVAAETPGENVSSNDASAGTEASAEVLLEDSVKTDEQRELMLSFGINMLSPDEISKLSAIEVHLLVTEVDKVISKKTSELAAIENYWNQLTGRMKEITDHYVRRFATRNGNSSDSSDRSDKVDGRKISTPIKNARISIRRTIEWALRNDPEVLKTLTWKVVKDKAMLSAFKNLKKSRQKYQEEGRQFPAELEHAIEQKEVPVGLKEYIDSRQKRYEDSREIALRSSNTSVTDTIDESDLGDYTEGDDFSTDIDLSPEENQQVLSN